MEIYKEPTRAFGVQISSVKLEEAKSESNSNLLILVSVCLSSYSYSKITDFFNLLIASMFDVLAKAYVNFKKINHSYIVPQKYSDKCFTLYLYANIEKASNEKCDKADFLEMFQKACCPLLKKDGFIQQVYYSSHVGKDFSRILDYYANYADDTHPTILDDNDINKTYKNYSFYGLRNYLADRYDKYKGSLEGLLPKACQSPLGIWKDSGLHYVLADVSAVINDRDVMHNDVQSLISFMAKHIPVFLVPEEEMKRLEMSIPPETRDLQPGEILGYYQHNAYDKTIDVRKKSVLNSFPQIAICPERIEELAAKVGMDYDTLYIQTLVHELSHALMDQYNHIQSDLSFATDMENGELYTCTSPNEVEKTAMEESLANCLTLQWFEGLYGKDSKEFKMAIDFMANNQPPVYEFGIYQYKINADWMVWYRYKNHDVQDALKDWYKKCFDCGKITDWAKNSYSIEDFRAALE